MRKAEETRTRSIIKGITWRLLASLSTIIVTFILTGNIVFAGILGSLDTIIKFIEYFLHERIWSWIPWGYRHFTILDEPEAQPHS
ncbi:MAG: DUF2061 domain-containing protein [Promethearchaeota archaeon]